MKSHSFLVVSVSLLLLAGIFLSCAKRGDASSQNVYYVVGYDGSSEVDIQKGTVKSKRYLFISENSRNIKYFL